MYRNIDVCTELLLYMSGYISLINLQFYSFYHQHQSPRTMLCEALFLQKRDLISKKTALFIALFSDPDIQPNFVLS